MIEFIVGAVVGFVIGAAMDSAPCPICDFPNKEYYERQRQADEDFYESESDD